jgi:hypothetical protein
MPQRPALSWESMAHIVIIFAVPSVSLCIKAEALDCLTYRSVVDVRHLIDLMLFICRMILLNTISIDP